MAVDSCMLPPMALYLTQMQFSTEANLPEVMKDHVSRLVVQFSNWTVHRIINTVFAKETLIDFLPEKINEMIVQVVFGRPASCVR